jgi:Mn-dependent DtxR family transcriptional regulator
MTSLWRLQQKREHLKRQIADNLDMLMGSVSTKGLKRAGYNLTYKVDQITRTRHIRKALVPKVREMIERHKKLKRLLQELSDVNWEIMKRQSE